MGKGRATRVTAQDLARVEGGVVAFIKQLVGKIDAGDAEAKETAAAQLRSLVTQNHGEHRDGVYNAKAIKPLVQLLIVGSAKAQESAAGVLHALVDDKAEYQKAIVEAGGLMPLVNLLKTGSAKVQEEVRHLLGRRGRMHAAMHPCHEGEGAAFLYHLPSHLALTLAPSRTLARSSTFAHYRSRILALALACTQPVSHLCCACQAASALAAIDADVAHQSGIIKAGAITPLVQMLKSGSAAAQAFAAQAIANAAAFSHEAQKLIAKAGSIPLLLTLLGGGKTQKPAASALAKLAHDNQEIQTEINDAGGIAPLLSLLNGLDLDAQVSAAAALCEMARDNLHTQSAIAKAGGIGPLLALLSSRSGAAQSQGMAALAQLARNNRENQDAIARMGGIRPLVQLLESNGEAVAAHAACALMEITRQNPANQKAVVDAGGISQLANLMKNSTFAPVKAEVAGALWSLSEDPEIKISIAEANTISPLVVLLGAGDARARDHAASALASLGLSNEDNQVQITQMLIELLSGGNEEAQVGHSAQPCNENPPSFNLLASPHPTPFSSTDHLLPTRPSHLTIDSLALGPRKHRSGNWG